MVIAALSVCRECAQTRGNRGFCRRAKVTFDSGEWLVVDAVAANLSPSARLP
jgi:hypothetical protein